MSHFFALIYRNCEFVSSYMLIFFFQGYFFVLQTAKLLRETCMTMKNIPVKCKQSLSLRADKFDSKQLEHTVNSLASLDMNSVLPDGYEDTNCKF